MWELHTWTLDYIVFRQNQFGGMFLGLNLSICESSCRRTCTASPWQRWWICRVGLQRYAQHLRCVFLGWPHLMIRCAASKRRPWNCWNFSRNLISFATKMCNQIRRESVTKLQILQNQIFQKVTEWTKVSVSIKDVKVFQPNSTTQVWMGAGIYFWVNCDLLL